MNEAQKLIMESITSIIASTNAGTFTITGYTHLKTRLVLHFADCDQVFDYTWIDATTMELNNKFFSADRDFLDQQKEFVDLYNKVQPEQE